MINVLEFDMSIDYKLAWNPAARACFNLFYQLPECMILYKHKLAEPYIWTKFGCSHPDRIKFDKLKGKNLIVFHTDVYLEDTHKIKDLLDYCEVNVIDIWIPFPLKNFWRTEEPHLAILKDIINQYQHNTYDLSNMNYRNETEIPETIRQKMKPVFRDIKLRNLFD